MSVFHRLLCLLSLLALGSPAFAQTPGTGAARAPQPSSSAAPRGKATPTGSAAPNGSAAPGATAPSTPPGHPGASTPRGRNFGAEDSTQPMTGIPKGTVQVILRDGDEKPVVGAKVSLSVLRASVPEGEKRSRRTGTTNASGQFSFGQLEQASRISYRIRVQHNGGTFRSQPFNLHEQYGHRVILHVYEVARQMTAARVAISTVVFVETRDDVFQFEVLYRVINIGRKAWLPDVSVPLPEGAKGFSARDSMGDFRVEGAGSKRVKLLGTLKPGEHEAAFTFQVRNPDKPQIEFDIPLPPSTRRVQVIALAPRGMGLSVEDFPKAERTRVSSGKPAWLTTKTLRSDVQQSFDSISFTLDGIPTRGPGALIAIGIAFMIAMGGLYRGTTTRAQKRLARSDRDRARKLLLEELARIELAYRNKQVGPRTYAQAKRTVLDALARILRPAN